MAERVRFSIDGRPAETEAGVSLLAALWNAGARALRRSVGGEPRGPLCGMGSCFECRVTLDGTPHVRACLATVREGMDVRLLDARSWDTRLPDTPLAGRGGHGTTARLQASPAGVEAPDAEVVVAGCGPAGLAAAVHAAEAGARTLVIDASARPGGQIWRHREGHAPAAARSWLARLERARVPVLFGTVVDATSRELSVESEGRARRVRFERLVIATGARELLLPFPGWTLPGVLGAGGAQAMIKAGARLAGQRVVVAGSGPLLIAVAAALAHAGATVVGVAEQAPLARLAAFALSLWRAPRKLAEGLGYGGRLAFVPLRAGSWVREVEHTRAGLRARLTDGRREWSWRCDVLASGYGLVPNLELASLLGCEIASGQVVTGHEQDTSVPGVYAAGELGLVAGVGHALATGAIAGLAAAGRPLPEALVRRRDRERAFGARLESTFALRSELRELARPETMLCRCEDAPWRALAGFATAREAKLATRAGMGPCQGRVCGAALSFLHGFDSFTPRPPLAPAPISVLQAEAGPKSDPI